MSSLEKLPLELKRIIFFALDNPSDLLHLALSCKTFYEMIVPTHHLDLTSISCCVESCDSKTPLKFWQTLCVSRHYASMIRQLRLCDQSTVYSLARRQFRGRRIDEEFVIGFGSDFLLPISAGFRPQDFLQQSLAYMDGLKSISILKKYSIEEYERLHRISNHFSNCLEVLHIDCTGLQYSIDSIPQYKSSDFAFHCLTSFSLEVHVSDKAFEPFYLLLDSLASDCHTLVNFALQSHWAIPIVYLVKKVTWPSLKKLTLLGDFQLTAHDRSREEDIDLYISFFARHSKLERLCVQLKDDYMDQFVRELGGHLSPVLPSLRSLDYGCSPSLDILSRLEHASTRFIPIDHYPIAQSLRSLIITGCTHLDDLYSMVDILPRQLERFSVYIVVPSEYKHVGSFELFLEDLPEDMSALKNLTHLEISLDYFPNDYVDDPRCCLESYINHLPSLIYFQFAYHEWLCGVFNDPSLPYTDQFHSLNNRSRSFRSEFWGEFFMGPLMYCDS